MEMQDTLILFCLIFRCFLDSVSPSHIHLASNSDLKLFLPNFSYGRDLEINGSDLVLYSNNFYFTFICEGNSPIEWTTTAKASGKLGLRQYWYNHFQKYVAEIYIGLWGKSRGTLTCSPLSSNTNDSVSVNLFVNGPQGAGFVDPNGLVYITDWILLQNKCQTVNVPCAISHPGILPTLYKYVNHTWIQSNYIKFDPFTGFRTELCLDDKISAFLCLFSNNSITFTLRTTKFHAEPDVVELFTFPGQELTLKCVGSNKSVIGSTDFRNSSSKILMQSTEWFDSTMTLLVHKIKLQFKQNLTVTCEDSDNNHSWNIFYYNGEIHLAHTFWEYQADQSIFRCQAPSSDCRLKNVECATVNECNLRNRNFKDLNGLIREINPIDKNDSDPDQMLLIGLLPFGSIECIAGTARLFIPYFTGLNGIKYFVGIDKIPDEAIIAFKSSMDVIESKGQTSELLMCTYSLFLLMQYTLCSLKYENGTVVPVSLRNMANYTDEDRKFVKSQKLANTWVDVGRLIITQDMDEAICGAYLRSNGEWKNVSYKFTANRRIKPSPASSLHTIILGVTAVGGLVVVSIATVIKILRLRQKKTLDDSDIDIFFNGGNAESREKNKYLVEVDAVDYALGIPYNDFYELQSEYLNYSFQNLIGKGAFGLVFSGSYLGKPVAIKTAKDNVDAESFKAAMAELKMLMYVGFHKHIVNFVGAVTVNIQKLQLEIVLELCSKGSLNTYLRKHLNQSNQESTGLIQLLMQQIKWCVDITHALEYLFQRKITHGDLATRNVLLDESLTAKLSDFGLSTKSLSYSAYVKKSKKALLPWRWMAVESLTKYNFSTASDMWSFGVVVWEIFTLGELPYPTQNWDETFLEFLNQGKRLPKPDSCPDKIYEVLLQCWDYEEKSRPSILKVREIFDVMMQIKSLEEKLISASGK